MEQQATAKAETPDTETPKVAKKQRTRFQLVTFQNIEFPNADLMFSFTEQDRVLRRYHLYDGQTIELPQEIIDHLNGLVVPTYEYEVDPTTKQVTSERRGVRNRFSVRPANPQEAARYKAELAAQ